MKSKRSRRSKDTSKKIGENNPAFVHGMRQSDKRQTSVGMRTFQKNRDVYKADMITKKGFLSCECCGSSSVIFEAHHIIYRSEKPCHPNLHNRENILLLCVKCHNKFHSNKSIRDEIVKERGLHLVFGNDVLDKADKALLQQEINHLKESTSLPL